MTTYATFTENCDWEGETWRFYIPVEGNEEALAALRKRVTVDDDDQVYTLGTVPLTEAEVDVRVAGPDDCDYLPAHTKLAGTLNLEVIEGKDDGDLFDVLYKGGIKDLVS